MVECYVCGRSVDDENSRTINLFNRDILVCSTCHADPIHCSQTVLEKLVCEHESQGSVELPGARRLIDAFNAAVNEFNSAASDEAGRIVLVDDPRDRQTRRLNSLMNAHGTARAIERVVYQEREFVIELYGDADPNQWMNREDSHLRHDTASIATRLDTKGRSADAINLLFHTKWSEGFATDVFDTDPRNLTHKLEPDGARLGASLVLLCSSAEITGQEIGKRLEYLAEVADILGKRMKDKDESDRREKR